MSGGAENSLKKLSNIKGTLQLSETEEDGNVTTKIFRKETNTDQYVHFTSNCHAQQKLRIVSTLIMNIIGIITKEEDKREEEHHIKEAFLESCLCVSNCNRLPDHAY